MSVDPVQISDTHFGTEQAAVMEALLVCAWQSARPHRASGHDSAFWRLPPVPLLPVPGNHDIPLFDVLTRLRDPFRLFRDCFGAQLKLPGACRGCLRDRASQCGRRHKRGALSLEQDAGSRAFGGRAGAHAHRGGASPGPDVHDAGRHRRHQAYGAAPGPWRA